MSEPSALVPAGPAAPAAAAEDRAGSLALAFLAGYSGHTRDAYRRDLEVMELR